MPLGCARLGRWQRVEGCEQTPRGWQIHLARLRGHDPELAVREPIVAREPACSLVARLAGLGVQLQIVGSGEQPPQDVGRLVEVSVFFVRSSGRDQRGRHVFGPVVEVAEHVVGAGERLQLHRSLEVIFRRSELGRRHGFSGCESEQVREIAQRAEQLQGLRVPRHDRQGAPRVTDSRRDPWRRFARFGLKRPRPAEGDLAADDDRLHPSAVRPLRLCEQRVGASDGPERTC